MFEWFSSLSFFSMLIVLVLAAVLVGFVGFMTTNIVYTLNMPPVWLEGENSYIDAHTGKRHNFGLLADSPTVYLSVVVPAYNETKRMPTMLDEAFGYLEERKKADADFSYEVIIVDDGSKDGTSKLAMEYAKKVPEGAMRVLTLQKNRGKGGAVRRGMLCARGEYILMVDADGATTFSELSAVESATIKAEQRGLAIGVGSRAHLREKETERRPFLRECLMRGFHLFVVACGVSGIKDTQCGFKLFSRKAAQLLMPNLHVERWAFDVELLFNAQRLGIPIVEVDVEWREIDGSTLDPLTATIQMAKDIFRIKLMYMFYVWRLTSETRSLHREFTSADSESNKKSV